MNTDFYEGFQTKYWMKSYKNHADDKLLCKVPRRICVVAAMLGKNWWA